MVFFLGEMNGKFVQISRFNMRNFAAKRREISRRNLVLVGEKSKALFTFSRRFSAKCSTQYLKSIFILNFSMRDRCSH